MTLKSFTTFIVLSLTFIIFSCDFDIEANKRLKENSFFFSTIMFFEDEQERLKDRSGFTKYVNFNGKEETMKIDSLNFMDEFNPFKNSDINKAVWLDRYMCDTTFQQKLISKIDCSCQDKKLKTQKLSIDYENGEVVEVRLENQMNKMLLTTMEYLTYTKDVSYEIKRIQMLETGGIDSTFVMVKF
jgi:hypothetical protein